MTWAELSLYGNIYGESTTVDSFSFFVLLTAGLVAGFGHCIGMCGPLVSTFMLHQHKQRADGTTSLLIFQMGRLTTYVLLGLLAGAVGSLVRFTIMAQGWQSILSIVIGLLMLIAGINLSGWWPLKTHLVPLGLLRHATARIQTLISLKHSAAKFALGLSNGLLPCGPIYAMLLLAAASGSSQRGVFIMLLFGLGTLPAMLGVGFFASRVSLRLRSQLNRVVAVMIVLVGIQQMLRGLALGNQLSHLSIAGVMLW